VSNATPFREGHGRIPIRYGLVRIGGKEGPGLHNTGCPHPDMGAREKRERWRGNDMDITLIIISLPFFN